MEQLPLSGQRGHGYFGGRAYVFQDGEVYERDA